jgi:hypothetical protein
MLKGWNPLKPGHSGNNMLNYYWLNGEKRPRLCENSEYPVNLANRGIHKRSQGYLADYFRHLLS